MTKGDYIRQCDDKELAKEFAGCMIEAIRKTLALLDVNLYDIITDETIREMLDACEKELGEEMP